MKQYEEAIKIIERLNDEFMEEGFDTPNEELHVSTNGYEFIIKLGYVIVYNSQDEDSEEDLEDKLLDNIEEYLGSMTNLCRYMEMR